jgi:hypothetical protein
MVSHGDPGKGKLATCGFELASSGTFGESVNGDT